MSMSRLHFHFYRAHFIIHIYKMHVCRCIMLPPSESNTALLYPQAGTQISFHLSLLTLCEPKPITIIACWPLSVDAMLREACLLFIPFVIHVAVLATRVSSDLSSSVFYILNCHAEAKWHRCCIYLIFVTEMTHVFKTPLQEATMMSCPYIANALQWCHWLLRMINTWDPFY